MGHIRVGRLPKTRRWKKVIELFDAHDSSSSDIAAATVKAAREFFAKNIGNPALVYSYWLLTQITYRAREDDFTKELHKIGFDIEHTQGALEFLGRVTGFARKQIKLRGEIFPLSEFAQLALREVLTETIGQHCQSLFGTTLADIKRACRIYSTSDKFAKLARLYFAKVMNRSLQFFISKETANRIGTEKKFEDITSLTEFNAALEAYCYQSAKVVEEFAGGWYSKRNWQGEISENDAAGFVSVAVKKFADEIARENHV